MKSDIKQIRFRKYNDHGYYIYGLIISRNLVGNFERRYHYGQALEIAHPQSQKDDHWHEGSQYIACKRHEHILGLEDEKRTRWHEDGLSTLVVGFVCE